MNNYHEEAAKNIAIDSDSRGLFCTVPSERDENTRYILRCTESATEVVVHDCSCPGNRRWGHCKHANLVSEFWGRIYKKKAAPKVKRTPLVRKVRNGGLVLVKAPTKVEQVATEVGVTVEQVQEIAVIAAEHNREKLEGKHTEMCLPIGPRDTKKDIMKAALTTNKGFSLLR